MRLLAGFEHICAEHLAAEHAPFVSALLCDLIDASTALAACCGFDLCHKYILYLYLYFVKRRAAVRCGVRCLSGGGGGVRG